MSLRFDDHADQAGSEPLGSVTPALETHPSVAVYTPARLALYDLFILGVSCSLVWRCPKRHFLDLYDQHVGSPHLEHRARHWLFLDRCRFPIEHPQITLLTRARPACARRRGASSATRRESSRQAHRAARPRGRPVRLGRAERGPPPPPGHTGDEGSRLPQPEPLLGERRRSLREHDPREGRAARFGSREGRSPVTTGRDTSRTSRTTATASNARWRAISPISRSRFADRSRSSPPMPDAAVAGP